MKISIVVPSYNQSRFIEETFKNLKSLKSCLQKERIETEILLFDSCSNEAVQTIIEKYRFLFDFLEIKKDKGQYDAINKGIEKASGDYWTWLNTDDLIDIQGCIKVIQTLKRNNSIDYIYGNISIIDESGMQVKEYRPTVLSLDSLLHQSSTITQPGSFIRTSFTRKIGLLKPYHCCFDYEYILRVFSNKGNAYYLNETVSNFRYYADSKSGALENKFVNEQLQIRKVYQCKYLSHLTWKLYKRKARAMMSRTLNMIN
ncbi:glycosyltransferase [bacterium]|nr:MAG: glycosyltransferase [bacterium]